MYILQFIIASFVSFLLVAVAVFLRGLRRFANISGFRCDNRCTDADFSDGTGCRRVLGGKRTHTEAFDVRLDELQNEFLVLHIGRVQTESDGDRIEGAEHDAVAFLGVFLVLGEVGHCVGLVNKSVTISNIIPIIEMNICTKRTDFALALRNGFRNFSKRIH